MPVFNILKATSLFDGLDDQVVRDVAQFSQRLEVTKGEVMLGEGDAKDHDLFLVVKGEIGFAASFSNWGGQQEAELSNVSKELFGEVAWLLLTDRTATVKCASDALLIRIDGAKLHDYLSSHPEAGYKLILKVSKVLALRLSSLTQHVKMLSSYAY